MISSNEKRMAELKQVSSQLQQTCSEPCRDSVTIQTTTGTGEKKKKNCDPQVICVSTKVSQSCLIGKTFVQVHCLVRS